VEHWLDGGPTSLDNLVLLCRRHHRSVHEGLVDVRVLGDGALAVIGPDGAVLSPVPDPPTPFVRFDTQPAPDDDLPTWDGTHFDVADAIAVLYAPRAPERAGDDGFKAASPRIGSSTRFRSR
jgi:hypothetical protein